MAQPLKAKLVSRPVKFCCCDSSEALDETPGNRHACTTVFPLPSSDRVYCGEAPAS
jgi:hypothetical protein